MNRRFYITILFTFSFVYSYAQKLVFEGEISTHFNNTEYTGSYCGSSGTIFATKIEPSLMYVWNDKHSITVGTELLKDFGTEKFLDETKLVAYYQFQNEKFGANAGIFGRSHLIGKYSRAFYSDSTLVYNSLIQGIALRYKGNSAFAEFALDWEGLYSPETREKFRILASAGGSFANVFDAGVSMSIQHYANKSTFEGNVVDNVLINPYIGVSFNAFFDFGIRLGYLQGMQRDRMTQEGWKAPMGGEFNFRISKWGVFIDNNLYVGKNLMPFYHRLGKDDEAYGSDLYTGDPFYGTKYNVYNRTGIGYERAFVKDKISVRAEMVLQYNGQKLYYQQLIGIAAKICPTLYDKAKHNKN